MKLTERENSSDSERNYRVKQEAAILKELSHAAPDRIINFIEFFLNDEDQFVLVMERAQCSLQDIMDQRLLNEDDGKIVMKALLEGLNVIHKHYYCHRDIKPANLMLSDRDDLSSLKIADFGICVHENGYDGLSGIKGTRGFMAPEVQNKSSYGRSVDIWSAGAVLYKALLGKLAPVIGKPKGFMSSKRPITFEGPNISDDAKDLLSKCLDSDSSSRPTAEQALQHPWFSSVNRSMAQAESPAVVLPQFIEGFEGWIQLTQPNGVIYFFNQITGVTQWEHPSTTQPPTQLEVPTVSPSQPPSTEEEPKLSSPRQSRPLPEVPMKGLDSHEPQGSATSLDVPPISSQPGSRSPSPRRVRFSDDNIADEEPPKHDVRPLVNVMHIVNAFQAPARGVTSYLLPKDPAETTAPGLPDAEPSPTPAAMPLGQSPAQTNDLKSTGPPIPTKPPHLLGFLDSSTPLKSLDTTEVLSPTSKEPEISENIFPGIIDDGAIPGKPNWRKVKIVTETIYYYDSETGQSVWSLDDTVVSNVPPPPAPLVKSGSSDEVKRAVKSTVTTKPRSPASVVKGTAASPTSTSSLGVKAMEQKNAVARKPSPSRGGSTPTVSSETRPPLKTVVSRSATTGSKITSPPTTPKPATKPVTPK
ncbi:hypothetical protein HDU97_008367 [Phlyctochytrium planicorne]|nr:hypothetical protein HDU97_008367 [Phlyctochytrium planicorne]